MSETTVEVGSTHVTLRSPSGSVRTAVILRREIRNGQAWVLLDRLVHEKYVTLSRGWKAAGCFVTELTYQDGVPGAWFVADAN